MKYLLFIDKPAFAELRRYVRHFEMTEGVNDATKKAVEMLAVKVPVDATEIEVIVTGGTASPVLRAA